MVKKISNIDYLKSEYKKINNLFLSKKFDLVIEKSKKILKKNSNQIPFYNLLALSYRETNKIFLAEKVLKSANEINPNDQSVLVNLGATYRVLLEFEKSEKFFKKTLSINPNNIHALVNYANLKRDTNNYDESILMYEEAYKLDNSNPIILINLAGTYQIIGKFEKSKKILTELLNRDKNNALAHKMLSAIKDYKKQDEHQNDMVSILEKNLLDELDTATLCYAISKSFDDQKDYKRSTEYFKKANDIQKKIQKNYSIDDEIKRFNEIKNIFNNVNFDEYPNYSNPKKIFFIVGLPRSGTTLAHQILAAHKKVQGAGEMIILDQFMLKNIYNKEITNLFNKYQKQNDEKLIEIIKNYHSKISYIQTKKDIILDKNPLNFQWLGFIKILFPNSKIIHCKRNLKDTALSIYKNAFDVNSLIWSNDQDDLTKFISLYLDLMKFWSKKIPNFIYDLNYEELIKNQKEEIEKILSYCEIEWDNDCLNFSKKNNPIKTVSVTQARKPIYNTSLNVYEKYNNYLDLFKKIENIKKL